MGNLNESTLFNENGDPLIKLGDALIGPNGNKLGIVKSECDCILEIDNDYDNYEIHLSDIDWNSEINQFVSKTE